MIDPASFGHANRLGIGRGDRVRYRTSGTFHPSVEGEGTVTLIWLGIEECFDVALDDGTEIHLYPALRDIIEPATTEETQP